MASSTLRPNSLFALIDNAAKLHGSRLAVHSPLQKDSAIKKLTYNQFRTATLQVASKLKERLGENVSRPSTSSKSSSGSIPVPQHALVSDIPNTVENLVLQAACSYHNIAYSTVKDEKMLWEFSQMRDENDKYKPKVKFIGAIGAGADSWLVGRGVCGLMGGAENTTAEELFQGVDGMSGKDSPRPASLLGSSTTDGDGDSAHGCFNTITKPLKSSELVSLGENAQTILNLTPEDRVCVSITLCHSFGIGSGVCAVLGGGSTLVLPAVGGLRGCGVPAERAKACLEVLRGDFGGDSGEKCTVLYSDAPVVKQMKEIGSDGLNLRTGVVKTGSGTDFLDERMEFGGVELWTMGKKSS